MAAVEEREVHPAAVRCDCCTRTTKCGCTLHPPRHYPHEQPTMLYFARGSRGVAGVGREEKDFGGGGIFGRVDTFRRLISP